jgi:hypothetical protein
MRNYLIFKKPLIVVDFPLPIKNYVVTLVNILELLDEDQMTQIHSLCFKLHLLRLECGQFNDYVLLLTPVFALFF